MVSSSETADDLGIFDALGQALQFYIGHFFLLAGFSFSASILPVVMTLIENAPGAFFSVLLLMLWPISVCLQFILFIALVLAVSKSALGEPVDVGLLLQEGVLRFWKYGLAAGLFMLILVAGVILLVVPFFYWLTIFAFFYFFIILEDKKIWAAFQASENLVQGRFWKILLAHLTVFGIALGMILPFAIGLAFMGVDGTFRAVTARIIEALIAPLFVSFYYVIFCWLKKTRAIPGSIAVYDKK